jgi:hypothetical protein
MPDLPSGYMKTLVDQQDNAPERSRVGNAGYVHVSSLVGLCTRQYALSEQRQDPVFKAVRGGHRVMWKIGRSVEAHIRDQFIRARNRAGVWGSWSCRCGHSKHVGFHSSNGRCTKCETGLHQYGEAAMFDHENRIVGNPDLPFLMGEYLVVSEIKSMTKKMFEALTEPLPDHVFQASMYHYLFSSNRFKVHDRAIIIYATKEFIYGSPYKEFHVDMTGDMVRRGVARAIEQARQITAFRTSQTLPARCGACSTHDSPTAKNCPVVTPCFALPA